ncbi:hypothetical protein EV356DRAFT_315980 [Viridothelium virens]|uniref:Uncharacterized protein n=1 Tax=Viridothelium virens TaxID=1048519 RepID=A0A6A6GZJ4_VIRVR|nr:hypothetical protein EV356DRAFT_315980 [Viridothelium virens]
MVVVLLSRPHRSFHPPTTIPFGRAVLHRPILVACGSWADRVPASAREATGAPAKFRAGRCLDWLNASLSRHQHRRHGGHRHYWRQIAKRSSAASIEPHTQVRLRSKGARTQRGREDTPPGPAGKCWSNTHILVPCDDRRARRRGFGSHAGGGSSTSI